MAMLLFQGCCHYMKVIAVVLLGWHLEPIQYFQALILHSQASIFIIYYRWRFFIIHFKKKQGDLIYTNVCSFSLYIFVKVLGRIKDWKWVNTGFETEWDFILLIRTRLWPEPTYLWPLYLLLSPGFKVPGYT